MAKQHIHAHSHRQHINCANLQAAEKKACNNNSRATEHTAEIESELNMYDDMQVDSKPEAATTLNSYKSMQTFIKLHIMIIIMCQNSYSEEEEKNRRMFS